MGIKYNATISRGGITRTLYGVTLAESYAAQAALPGSTVTFRPQLWLARRGGMYVLELVAGPMPQLLFMAPRLSDVEAVRDRYAEQMANITGE